MIFIKDIKKLSLRVSGIPCASCVIPTRRKLESTDGVKSVGANYLNDLLLVEYDSRVINESAIIELIRRIGYNAIAVRR